MLEKVFWVSYHARHRPDQVALLDRGTGLSLTYAELDDRVRRLAAALAGRGIGSGDRVAVLSLNSLHVHETLYACARLGAIMVPLNFRLAPGELRQILADAGPAMILHDDVHRDLVAAILDSVDPAGHSGGIPTLEWVCSPDADPAASSYERALAAALTDTMNQEAEGDLPWVIIYTSGTTGRPKGVVHTVVSVMANLVNSAMAYGVTFQTRSLTILPTFHVAGLNLLGNDVLLHGGTLTIMQSFDAREALRILSDPQEAITHFGGGPPAVLNMISSLPEFEHAELPSFVTAVGGSPVPASLIQQWAERGVTVIQAFGATEAGSTVLAPSASSPDGFAGAPAAYAQAEVRDADGAVLGEGVPGELWVRGPMLMREYWGRPEETRATVVDGWLRTGDIALHDGAGSFRIVDRNKDMYISGGENVYPSEAEAVLYGHPDIHLVAVIGVPHERWGETGIAYLVLKDGRNTSAEELRGWCRERLAGYKVPSEFRFRDQLPVNASGKIVKRELRGQLEEAAADA